MLDMHGFQQIIALHWKMHGFNYNSRCQGQSISKFTRACWVRPMNCMWCHTSESWWRFGVIRSIAFFRPPQKSKRTHKQANAYKVRSITSNKKDYQQHTSAERAIKLLPDNIESAEAKNAVAVHLEAWLTHHIHRGHHNLPQVSSLGDNHCFYNLILGMNDIDSAGDHWEVVSGILLKKASFRFTVHASPLEKT